MAVSYSIAHRNVIGAKRQNVVDITLDSSYATGGESVTAAGCGLSAIEHLQPSIISGYVPEWDQTNSKLKMRISEAGGADITTNTGAVVDDDSAASNGTAVNIVVNDDTGPYAYLESTTAGNADTTFLIGSGGPAVGVNDNDTPGGVQLYFDEDAANADERFLCVSPTNADLWLTASDGSIIVVKDDNSAATNGVAVYIDDDASNAYEKLLFVSPTDADGSYATSDTITAQAVAGTDAVLAEVASATNLSAVTVRCVVTGR